MYDALIVRMKFREFVRVNFDGSAFNTTPQGTVGFDVGSRCSWKQEWRSRMHLKEGANGLWERDNTNSGNNEVELGQSPLQPR